MNYEQELLRRILGFDLDPVLLEEDSRPVTGQHQYIQLYTRNTLKGMQVFVDTFSEYMLISVRKWDGTTLRMFTVSYPKEESPQR